MKDETQKIKDDEGSTVAEIKEVVLEEENSRREINRQREEKETAMIVMTQNKCLRQKNS